MVDMDGSFMVEYIVREMWCAPALVSMCPKKVEGKKRDEEVMLYGNHYMIRDS
jgi:hypothetical protein